MTNHMTAQVLALQRYLAGFWIFLVYAATHLRALRIVPVRTVFERQLYFTGIEGLVLVSAIGLMTGTVFSSMAAAILGTSELSMRTLIMIQVVELGPVIAAIIIIARSSVAMAAELALMHAHDETTHLRLMRIPPLDYLVVPRIAAVTLSVFALTVYFQAVAVTSSLATNALFHQVTFVEELGRFFSALEMDDIFFPAAKSLAFGLAISCISCFHGLDVGKSITSIPIAAVRAVVHSLIAVFLIDGAIAYARYTLL
jgi:phospholipid/cholesterol/gamma-HCH transport system permease protein